MSASFPPRPQRARQLLPKECYYTPEWFEAHHVQGDHIEGGPGHDTIRGGYSGADRPFDGHSPCRREAAEGLPTALLDRKVLGYPGRQAIPEEVDVGVPPLHQLGNGIGRPLAPNAIAVDDDRLRLVGEACRHRLLG